MKLVPGTVVIEQVGLLTGVPLIEQVDVLLGNVPVTVTSVPLGPEGGVITTELALVTIPNEV